MATGDPLGHVEFSVLDAVNRGALRSRRTAQKVDGLREDPAGEAILHAALRRCERAGLLSSARDGSGRQYRVTAAGRARLRADRSLRAAMARMLLSGRAAGPACGARCS
jgi:DNA-binding PadR family transcriptional regulator